LRRLIASGADRLADVEGLELGELVGVLLDDVGKLEQQLAAFARRGLEPLGKRLLRCSHRAVDVLGRPARDLRDRLAGGRVADLHRLAADGLDPLAADEVLVLANGHTHELSSPPLDLALAGYISPTGSAATAPPRRSTPWSRVRRWAIVTGMTV